MQTMTMWSACAAAWAMIVLALGCGGREDDEMAPAYTTVPVSAGGGDDDDAGEGDAGSSGTSDAADDATVDDDGGQAGTSGPGDGSGDAPPPPDDGPASGDGAADDATGDAGGPAAECLAQAVTECETCACNTCLSQLQACEQDPGCVAIRTCAQQNMCTGIGCLGPCGDVIDEHGGALGPSAGLASTLSDCVEGGCPAC